MTRENIIKNIGIISAFAEGKVIQILNEKGEWIDLTEREGLPIGTLEETPDIFRIRSEPKYRPFANAEECWQEMLRHEPFGWIINRNTGKKHCITAIHETSNEVFIADDTWEDFYKIKKNYTFTDGVPFGVKNEED